MLVYHLVCGIHGVFCLAFILGIIIFILITLLFLMCDQVKDPGKNHIALLTLVLHVACSNIPFIGELSFFIIFSFCLVLIALPGFLTSILEPYNDNPSREVENSRKLFYFIIFWVSVCVKKVLQNPKLVVRKPCSG